MTGSRVQTTVLVGVEQLFGVFRDAGLVRRPDELGDILIEPIKTGQMADTVRCRFQNAVASALSSSCVVKLPIREG